MYRVATLALQKNVYMQVVNLCSQARAYYRYKVIPTKNDSHYLKIVCRKGMFFSDQELQFILRYVHNITQGQGVVKYNVEKGTLTVTV